MRWMRHRPPERWQRRRQLADLAPPRRTVIRPVVIVNNSRETFTPTTSGAISTHVFHTCVEAAKVGTEPLVVSIGSDEPTYAWHHLSTVRRGREEFGYTVLNKVFSYVLGIGTVILGVLVLPKANFHAHPHLGAPTHVGAWLLALLVMAAAPLSWVNTAADYSRYLPSRTPGRRITLWTTLGNLIPAVLITMIGVAAATATDMTDPVAGLKNILPSWFFVGYLAVIVGGTITNNFLNTYSSGMSLLALGLKVKRWQAVVIDATVGTSLSVYALFVFDFTNSFIEFLSLMVLWIAPFGGVYLADMLLRRGRYDVEALYATSGRYWFWKGWNLHALGWFLAGVVGAAMFSSSAAFDGPLVSSIGGGDISIYVGLTVPFVGYLVTMRRRVEFIPDAALLPTQRSPEGPTGEAAPSQLTNLSNSGPA